MRTLVTILISLLTAALLPAQDTFSIIAADPETGEIGAAGASCVDGIADLGGIQVLNRIIPGRGGVNAQAYICLNPHINLDNAIGRMRAGLNPSQIISWLQNNDDCFSRGFNPSYRQYGIVDFAEDGQVRTAAFTGENCDEYKGHRTGPTYAIQGNILLGPEILDSMENAFNNTNGSLAEKLMAAMQGANVAGADTRCLDRGTSSTSAFLRVAKPMDSPSAPFLELNVLEMPFGEEPIDSLQTLFDAWQLTSSEEAFVEPEVALFPNPNNGQLQVRSTATPVVAWQLFSATGQRVDQVVFSTARLSFPVDLSSLPSGSYFLQLRWSDGKTMLRPIVKS